MVDFAGWAMPLAYPTGTVAEHLATRREAGLFDISHMGRILVGGTQALKLLQRVLSNNAAALEPYEAQYAFIPTETGGAIDDVYLYRYVEDEFLLVVNAANAGKVWQHLRNEIAAQVPMESWTVDKPGSLGGRAAGLHDITEQEAMLSLQGPRSRDILESVIQVGRLPEPRRNQLSVVTIAGTQALLSRSGYTGEPLCFELFVPSHRALLIWDLLINKGATPCGLGARDTLRLEAGLPLYGQELGMDPEGNEIPLFSSPLAAFAVSFSPVKGDYVGRAALARQHEAYKRILARDYSLVADLPRITRPVALTGKGVARAGSPVFKDKERVGWVTSGTMVPYWRSEGEGLDTRFTDQHGLRSICLALLDSRLEDDDRVTVEIRGREVEGVVVPYHLRSDAPPYARPIVYSFAKPQAAPAAGDEKSKAGSLLRRALENHAWRQRDCINLIPSEMTASPLVRLLSVSDPAFRYAEHRKLEAFYDTEVFYYQGTGFIDEVERLLEAELRYFLGAAEVETRIISGQMANAAVFSAIVDYLNRGDPKSERKRIPMVMNNHIGKGGHLSAQPMGALRDFVAIDPRTDRPAVVNFPVLPENEYRIDLDATFNLIYRYRPQLIILGKSMVLHREPVAEIRRFLDEQQLDSILMYDMAHVLGLTGPHFQQPFAEGADVVTGSTHKTFFGTQRGLIAGRITEHEERYDLWEAIERRTFPGSVSNHHLGTLLGLLLAAYEMNHFKDAYQQAVIANAKAFARSLAEQGLKVAGDPSIDYTETHQVIVDVGYGRGPEIAERLERSNIICNYQAGPDEEGFTASGALRLGTAEMTRFGMEAADFGELSELIAGVITKDVPAAQQVSSLRRRFLEMRYCFTEADFPEIAAELSSRLGMLR